MFQRETLTAEQVRNLDEDTYIVVELHEDEYWQQGEGRVVCVEGRGGSTTVVFQSHGHGHTSRLKIPSDAREGLTLDGAARGASGLRVESVRVR